MLGTANAPAASASTRTAWGHEGGNGITVATVNPGARERAADRVASPAPTITVVAGDERRRRPHAARPRRSSQAINASPGGSRARQGLHLPRQRRRRRRRRRPSATLSGRPVGPRLGVARPADGLRDPHRQAARRLQARRARLRPGARTRVGAAAGHDRDRRATAAQLRARTAETKKLVNNLDIWIVPSVNPDGGHYSFYDFDSQRRNMTRHCPVTGSADFIARNAWGVDNNRNYDDVQPVRRLQRRVDLAARATRTPGPSELSASRRARTSTGSRRNNPNIKFAMNLHSSGNYFMWSPGAYITPGSHLGSAADASRTSRSSGARRRGSSPRSSSTAACR